MVPWIPLETSHQLDALIKRSYTTPIAIFKHSTTCSISGMAKMRLEDHWSFDKKEMEVYYLDLLRFRKISNEIAERFSVHHQSPQILLIKNGECSYDSSHLDISVAELRECY